MAEPTDAERSRVWGLVEQILEEAIKPEVDWPKVRQWVQELATHIDSFLDRPGS